MSFGSGSWRSLSGKVTIKKYANRRLYDTESSTYITLDRLAAMVREGREFEVVDAKTGEDITRQVLTQIIVDEEARGVDHAADQFPQAADRPLRQFDADLRAAISRSGDGGVPAQPERGARRVRRQHVRRPRQAQHGDVRGCQPQAFTGKAKAEPSRQAKRQRRWISCAPSSPRCRPKSTGWAAEPCMHRASACAALPRWPPLPAFRADRALPTDHQFATPVAGSWTYSSTAGGSEAAFHRRSRRRAAVAAMHAATRRVTIRRPARRRAPFLFVWTSTASRNLAAQASIPRPRASRPI